MSSIVPDRLPGRRRERRWINGWLMTTDHTRSRQREIGALFLEGQGWGFGGSVDIAPIDPWNVPGRYGWVGRDGNVGARQPVGRHGRHPAHPGRGGQPGRAELDAGLLAVHGQRLLTAPRKPG